MPTQVTSRSVQDSDGNVREILVSTTTTEGATEPERVEYHLGAARLEKQPDGSFRVADTGEVLSAPAD